MRPQAKLVLTIVPPRGYMVNEEKSTFRKIVFKEIEEPSLDFGTSYWQGKELFKSLRGDFVVTGNEVFTPKHDFPLGTVVKVQFTDASDNTCFCVDEEGHTQWVEAHELREVE